MSVFYIFFLICLLAFIVILIITISFSKIFQRVFGKLNLFFSLIVKLLMIITVCIILRLFVFEIFYIPSSSMESTLTRGDYVLISKLEYGPRLPRSIVESPWINLLAHHLLPKEYIMNLIHSHKPYKRIRSLSNAKRGDIIVFNIPTYQRHFGIKRCAGVPGDTINSLPNQEYLISNNVFIKSDSLGNFIIPRKGKTVISNKDFKLNSKLIMYPKKGRDEVERSSYRLKHDYYYMLGDNPQHSTDSRTWGLLQEDHIVGKAIYILYSRDENKSTINATRWERIFKPL